MTEQEIKDRLKMIETQMEQALANFNVLVGAKQEALFWLAKFDVEKDKKLESNQENKESQPQPEVDFSMLVQEHALDTTPERM